MKKEHFKYTYVSTGLDCPPSVKAALAKILYANGIDRIDGLCSKTEEEVMCINGLTPYMQKKLRDFMEKYGLRFEMTDDEIREYIDYDYFESHPEEKALYDGVDEEVMDEIFQADFLKQMAKGRGENPDYELIEVDSIEEQQENRPEPSTELENPIVETSCDEDSMTEDEARELLEELDRNEFCNYDPYSYIKPDEWEITLHSAAIRFMASDSWLTKLFMSDEKRLKRALKNAKSLYDSLRTDARQRGEKSRSIRRQCKEEKKRILDKFPEILNRKVY